MSHNFTVNDLLNVLTNAIYTYKPIAQDQIIHNLMNKLFDGNLFIPDKYETLLSVKLKTKGIIINSIDPNNYKGIPLIKGPASY